MDVATGSEYQCGTIMNESDMLILIYMAKGTQKEDQHSHGLA